MQEHPFKYGQQVIIDGYAELVTTVSGFCYEVGRITVRCSWFANGVYKKGWFDVFRLAPCPGSAEDPAEDYPKIKPSAD